MIASTRRGAGLRAVVAFFSLALAGAGGIASAEDDLTAVEEAIEGPYALVGTLHVAEPATLDVLVLLDRQASGDAYAVRLSPAQVSVERVVGGKSAAIGRTRSYGRFEADTDLELTVRRDGWRIEVILDRQVLARAYDATLQGGQVAYRVRGGEIPDAMLQPIGEVFMTDDFMRAADAQGTWEPIQGSWKTQSLRVDEQRDRMEAEKSANAFSYYGQATEVPAIACSGWWFWDNYSVSAAVRPVATDPLGVVAYFQDPENYIVARWTSALGQGGDADRLQLLAVVGGQSSVLAEAAGGHLPGQWYRIELRVCDGLMQALIDDEPRLIAQADLFGQGRPGLYCEGTGGTFFDSVRVEDWQVLALDFEQSSPGMWVIVSGQWGIEEGRMRGGGPEALAVTGRPQWRRYAHAADLCAQGKAAVGLAAGVADGRAFALRFGAAGSGLGYEGQAQLVRIEGGQTSVLASTPAHLPAGSWHRASLVIDDGLLTGYLDGKRILDAFDADAVSGLAGFYASGAGRGLFDNLYLSMLPPRRIARVMKEFTEDEEHPEMAEWASTRAPWLTPEREGGTWWTKGEYFGDKSVAFEIPGVGARQGSVTLRLDTAPESPDAGLTLEITSQRGSKTLALTLRRDGQVMAETSAEASAEPCAIRFERRGTWVVVVVDGSVVISEKL
ncbi:MAG: hypothetical protein AB7Y46_20255 [Armatimonadota bacterium]